MRFFKNDNYIDDKVKQLINNNFDCKILNNIYNKIKLIRTIQSKYNIIDFDIKGDFDNNKLTNNEYNLIKSTFRLTRNIPTNNDELMLMYVTMIKHICGSDIIVSSQMRYKNERIRTYNYNMECYYFHNNLASYYTKKQIILDLFEDNLCNKKIDDNIVKTKITLKKLDFDIDELLSYIKDGKSFLKSYLYSINIDKNINFYE
jgi:hypothetical protein